MLNGRIIIYIAGDKPSLETPNCSHVITFTRPTIQKPLYIGIKTKVQEPIVEPVGQGIIVLAGWDPTDEYQKGTDDLYIRGV